MAQQRTPTHSPEASTHQRPAILANRDSITRIMLRPLATPLPLGFIAFGIGHFMLSSSDLGWIGAQDSLNLALILLAFALPLQLGASVIGFMARDAPGGTTFAVLGASWAATGSNLMI